MWNACIGTRGLSTAIYVQHSKALEFRAAYSAHKNKRRVKKVLQYIRCFQKTLAFFVLLTQCEHTVANASLKCTDYTGGYVYTWYIHSANTLQWRWGEGGVGSAYKRHYCWSAAQLSEALLKSVLSCHEHTTEFCLCLLACKFGCWVDANTGFTVLVCFLESHF